MLWLFLLSCALFPDAPRYTDARFEAAEVSAGRTAGDLVFRIHNPNDDTVFSVDHYSYQLLLDDEAVMQGGYRGEGSPEILPGQSAEVRIPLVVEARQRPASAAGQDSLSLTLEGTLWMNVGAHSIAEDPLTLRGTLPIRP